MKAILRSTSLAVLVTIGAWGGPYDLEPETFAEVANGLAGLDHGIRRHEAEFAAAFAAVEAATRAREEAEAALAGQIAREVSRAPDLAGREDVLRSEEAAAKLAAASLPELREQLRAATLAQAEHRALSDAHLHLEGPDRDLWAQGLWYRVQFCRATLAEVELLAPAFARTSSARAALREATEESRRCLEALEVAKYHLREARFARHRLQVLGASLLAPAYLNRVTVEAVGDTLQAPRTLFQVEETRSEAAERLDSTIGVLLEAYPRLCAEVARRGRESTAAEARLAAVAARQQEAEALQGDRLSQAYLLQALLEGADSTVSLVREKLAPSAVFFEAAWRLGEMASSWRPGSSSFPKHRIESPTLDADLATFRQEVTARLDREIRALAAAERTADSSGVLTQGSLLVQRASHFAGLPSRFWEHVTGDQLGELQKWVVGNVAPPVVEGIAQAASAVVQGDTEALSKFLRERRYLTAPRDLAETLDRLELADAAGDAIQEVEKHLGRQIAEDLATSIGVTATKWAITQAHRARMVSLANRTALLDIEHMLRIYEFTARRVLFQEGQRVVRELEAAIASQIGERLALEPVRRTVSRAAPPSFATADHVQVRLYFSGRPDAVEARLGGLVVRPVPGPDGTFLVDLPRGSLRPDLYALEVRAGRAPVRGHELDDASFDADPGTVPRYDPDYASHGGVAAAGLEHGPCRAGSLSFADARLELVRPKAGGYLPGDWLDVRCELPGSLARRPAYLVVTDVTPPFEVRVRPGTLAAARYPVPLVPGGYELRLVAGGDPLPVASAPFSVARRRRTSAGNRPFAQIDSLPLSDRGPTFEPGRPPSQGGLGRISFDLRDAADQFPGAPVSLRSAGSEVELARASGGEGVDLPPGVYDAVIESAIPIDLPGIQVAAGRTTVVTAGGWGRLGFECRDAMGEPISPHVTIRRAGSDTAVAELFSSRSVDLPPGRYLAIISATPAIEVADLAVERGRETLVATSGYGRVAVEVRDATGREITPPVSIRKAGAEEELARTYAGSYADVPPGSYDLVYETTAPVRVYGIEVSSRRTTECRAQGFGRLLVEAVDADGKPTYPPLWIRRTHAGDVVASWNAGSPVDLAPGSYRFNWVGPGGDEGLPVKVARGGFAAARIRVP